MLVAEVRITGNGGSVSDQTWVELPVVIWNGAKNCTWGDKSKLQRSTRRSKLFKPKSSKEKSIFLIKSRWDLHYVIHFIVDPDLYKKDCNNGFVGLRHTSRPNFRVGADCLSRCRLWSMIWSHLSPFWNLFEPSEVQGKLRMLLKIRLLFLQCTTQATKQANNLIDLIEFIIQ